MFWQSPTWTSGSWEPWENTVAISLIPFPFSFSWGIARGNGYFFLSHLWGCFHVKGKKAVSVLYSFNSFWVSASCRYSSELYGRTKITWSNDIRFSTKYVGWEKERCFEEVELEVWREREGLGEHSWRVVSSSGGSGLLWANHCVGRSMRKLVWWAEDLLCHAEGWEGALLGGLESQD